MRITLPLILLLTGLSPFAFAQEGEESEEAGAEESPDGEDAELGEDEEPGDEEGERDPSLAPSDDEEWSWDGEVEEEEPEEVPVEEEDEEDELPPEPRRYGVSGNWYEVPLACRTCTTLLGQSFEVEGANIMRRFFDHLQIDANRRGGKVVYPTRGENRPVIVRQENTRVQVLQYIVEPERNRSTDAYAILWDLEVGPGDELLYGRSYRVETPTEAAYEGLGDGYQADPAFLAESRLLATLDLAPVQQLNGENPQFPIAEDALINYTGMYGLVRSDFTGEQLASHQEELQAAADAEAERQRQMQAAREAGDRAYAGDDLEGAISSYEQAIELGLSDDVDLRFNLGAAHQQLRNYDQALVHYGWLLEQNPRDTDVRFNMARVLERQGELEAAIEEYETLLKWNPDDSEAEDRIRTLRRRLEG